MRSAPETPVYGLVPSSPGSSLVTSNKYHNVSNRPYLAASFRAVCPSLLTIWAMSGSFATNSLASVVFPTLGGIVKGGVSRPTRGS
ncbi:hypothetical protein HanIR_Chr14g0688461 [Helianthus annuus]|nr:hypothetical protein HanIR_Chr14g0688461 [Helianthus annuus]